MKPATKVVFPGMEFGSAKATSRFSLMIEPETSARTFVEISCHAFVIAADEGVILGDASSSIRRIARKTLLQGISWSRAPGRN